MWGISWNIKCYRNLYFYISYLINLIVLTMVEKHLSENVINPKFLYTWNVKVQPLMVTIILYLIIMANIWLAFLYCAALNHIVLTFYVTEKKSVQLLLYEIIESYRLKAMNILLNVSCKQNFFINSYFLHSGVFPGLFWFLTDKESRKTWVREEMTVFLEQTVSLHPFLFTRWYNPHALRSAE